MYTRNILGKNPLLELRVLVAESLLQPMVALERPTASRSDLIPREPLEDASVIRPTENPLENLLSCPLSEVSLEHVLSDAGDHTRVPSAAEARSGLPLRMEEPMENVPASSITEKTLTNALVCPLTLSMDPFLGLGHFSLRNLYSSLSTSSRTKWWSSFSTHSSHNLSCAPILISSILGTFSPRGRYPVPRGTCLVGSSSPGVYARSLLPSWGRRCVLTIPGGGLSYAFG